MKRRLSILPLIEPHKKQFVSYDACDFFSLCFLIDFSVCRISDTWDTEYDFLNIISTIEKKYKVVYDKKQGFIKSWFSQMSTRKQRDLATSVFNKYKDIIRDPTDKRYIAVVEVYCLAFQEVTTNSIFGYIIKYSEINNKWMDIRQF